MVINYMAIKPIRLVFEYLLIMISFFFIPVSHAASLNTFNHIIFFGDSLTDNGNLYSAMIGFMPKSPPYFEGRFSNGPVWSELVNDHYQTQNITAENYAVGGETTYLHNPASGYLPFTLTASLDDYLIRTIYTDRSNTLFVILIGANDYLPGVTDAEATTSYVISNIKSVIESLIYHGGKHFIIFNLPDLSKTPYGIQNHLEKELNQLTNLHNGKLNDMLAQIHDGYKNVSIHLFDINSLFTDIMNKKLIKNTTDACWMGGYTVSKAKVNQQQSNMQEDLNNYLRVHQFNKLANASKISLAGRNPADFAAYAEQTPDLMEAYTVSKMAEGGTKPCDDPDDHLFWDHVHPTHIMHQMLSDAAIQFIDQSESIP